MGCAIDAAQGQVNAGLLGRRRQGAVKPVVIGTGEVNVGGAGCIEGMLPAPGVVDDLMGSGQIPGAQRRVDAAHGVNGNQALGAQFPEQPEVGPVVDGVRGEAARLAVAIAHHQSVVLHLAFEEAVRGGAVGSVEPADALKAARQGNLAGADDEAGGHYPPSSRSLGTARMSGRLRQ